MQRQETQTQQRTGHPLIPVWTLLLSAPNPDLLAPHPRSCPIQPAPVWWLFLYSSFVFITSPPSYLPKNIHPPSLSSLPSLSLHPSFPSQMTSLCSWCFGSTNAVEKKSKKRLKVEDVGQGETEIAKRERRMYNRGKEV